MNLILTWKKLAIGHVNGKCNLTTLPTNKHLQFINLLSDHILTMVIFYMINQIKEIFKTKKKKYNTRHV